MWSRDSGKHHGRNSCLQKIHVRASTATLCLQKVAVAAGALSSADEASIERFLELYSLAEVYYAYEIVHNILTMPFRDVAARVVFNVARFLLMRMLAAPQMRGISLGSVVFVLAREAESQGAWKLARFAYHKLQTLKVRIPVPTRPCPALVRR